MAKPHLVTSASQSPLFLSFRDRGLERKFLEDQSAKARTHDLQVGSLDAWQGISSTEQHALLSHMACLCPCVHLVLRTNAQTPCCITPFFYHRR
jgi:hypothetical protein